jgi:tryptophanyl-tRNA synthetase
MDLQEPTAKMSKSADSPGTIAVLEEPAVISKRLRSAVTDSDSDVRFDPEAKPGVSNLLEILAASSGRRVDDLASEFDGQGYGALKSATAESVVELLRPVQARYAELERDPASVQRALALGAEKAEAMAAKVVERVRAATGLLPRS